MRVETTPHNFKAASTLRIRQCYKKNQNNPALYRNITEFLREYNIPANIKMGGKKDMIEITYNIDFVKTKLKELQIGYFTKK